MDVKVQEPEMMLEALRGVIEKNYNNHKTHEIFLYHWYEDQNLGNPLFNVLYLHFCIEGLSKRLKMDKILK